MDQPPSPPRRVRKAQVPVPPAVGLTPEPARGGAFGPRLAVVSRPVVRPDAMSSPASAAMFGSLISDMGGAMGRTPGAILDSALDAGSPDARSTAAAWTSTSGRVPPGQAPQTRHTGRATRRDGDPDVAYAFDVQIGGVHYATFSEVSGLSWKADTQPMPEGGNNQFERTLIRPGKFAPLTLRRGWFAASGEFVEMLRGVLQPGGKVFRKNVTITVYSRHYEKVGRYDLSNALVVEYEGPAFHAMSGQIGFEQIRMVYDQFTYTPED